ncbi:MAG: terpene cyclase/mutase family protein [Acidobacteria bacterium]|nr:terpene cyclase/mutase family protein [Acidobacteriota bacterium]
MILSRRTFVALPLAAACPAARERAARYLWSRQAEDGGWHSGVYGLLKAGESLTGFVLDALLQVPGGAPPGGVDRALDFLRRHTNAEGAVGLTDPALADYPSYATACAVLALSRARRDTGPMVIWLRTQKIGEEGGWGPSDPPYGAWGMGGARRVAPHPGHIDLSMNRYVLQALAGAGIPAADPVFARARVFIERCQNPDGGFVFSTIVLGANKAGKDGGHYRSYGTTTADGLLSLLALGYAPRHERVQAALGWLRKHHRPDGASGFTGEPYQRWTQALRFYYAAACAEVCRRLGLDPLPHDLERAQRADGSWANPDDLVKEDDPLIATAFAVRALL